MEPIQVLDNGFVNEIEYWGSDERIIESARMSTSGTFRGWETEGKLLKYLWEHKHHSPFEHAGLTIDVLAPIFVFREWHRHRTFSYNELSSRYTALPSMYYIPSVERIMSGVQSKKNKQSSEIGFSEDEANYLQGLINHSVVESRKTYELLLERGLARELARVVIPVNQYSHMRASGNLRNWLHFLSLRLDPSAQWEIRQYAEAVAAIIQQRFPRTYALFEEGGRQA